MTGLFVLEWNADLTTGMSLEIYSCPWSEKPDGITRFKACFELLSLRFAPDSLAQ